MWPPLNNIGDCLCYLFVFGGNGHHHLLSFVYIELTAGVLTPLHEVQKSRAMMLCVTSVMNVCLVHDLRCWSKTVSRRGVVQQSGGGTTLRASAHDWTGAVQVDFKRTLLTLTPWGPSSSPLLKPQ